MRTVIALSLIIIGLLSASPAAAQGEVYLHHVTGQFTENALFTAPVTVTFHVAFRNTTGQNVKAFVNGFRLFTPTGAGWQPLTYAFSDTIAALFNTLTVQQRSNNGAISDTLIFVGVETTRPGLPAGFDGVAFTITTTFAYESAGHVICFDAIGSPNWGWSDSLGEPLFPYWSGLVCYDLYNFVNYPPQITNCPSNVYGPYGSVLVYDFNAQDPEYESVAFEVISGPGSIEDSTGIWTYVPTPADIGQTRTLTVIARDPGYNQSSPCEVPVTVILVDSSYVLGHVKDKYTGENLSGFTVWLWQDIEPLAFVVTDSAGTFDFGVIPRGEYTLKIDRPGYHSVEEFFVFDTGLEDIGDVFLYDLVHFVSAEPIQTAFASFQTAFHQYLESECAGVQSTLDFMFNRLRQPAYANGRVLATDLVNQLPYSSSTVPQWIANEYGVFSERNPSNLGAILYWVEQNTYLDHFGSDLAGFLQAGSPPGNAIYQKKVIGIKATSYDPPTWYSMDELLTLAAEPVNIPAYVLPDFPMDKIVHTLETTAAQLSAYAAAPADEPLPRILANLYPPGYSGNFEIPFLPLSDLALTNKEIDGQFAGASPEERSRREVAVYRYTNGGLSGMHTESADPLPYYPWPRSSGAGSSDFTMDVLSAPIPCDLAINLLFYCAHWPMKLAESYLSYLRFASQVPQILDSPSGLTCDARLGFADVFAENPCVPAGTDYAYFNPVYILTGTDDYHWGCQFRSRIVRVRTGFGRDIRTDLGGSLDETGTPLVNDPMPYGVELWLPRADLFSGPCYYEIVTDAITPAGLIPGPVTTAAAIPEELCGRADWFEETIQRADGLIAPNDTVAGDLTVAGESIWQRIRMRFGAGDVDLHLYDDVGGHLGRDYSTGTIENTLGDAVLLGDSTTEETIDFHPQPDRLYQYKLVGVDLPDSETVALSVISFTPMAPTPVLSPTALAGFGYLRDTVSASIHLFDLSGQNTITIDSFVVSDVSGPGGSMISASALTIIRPEQVPPDSSAALIVSFYADTTLTAGVYTGTARLVTDAGIKNFGVVFQLSSGYMCGDANGDQSINIGDAVYLVNYVFRGGPAPNPYEAGNPNCDQAVNIGDAVYLVNYIFRGGPAPCCP